MEINIRFLENLRLAALFEEFNVITDQPIRYKGDGSAPSPFDYFLSSTALCAAYFAKVYCLTRGLPTDDIKISQNNVVDPENRYKQTMHIKVELPAYFSPKDKEGILRSIERCTVKKVIENNPEFKLEVVESLGVDAEMMGALTVQAGSQTMILGKDLPLEKTIEQMTGILSTLGIKLEVASWRNIVPNVWSVHIRDAAAPMCYTNGKGATKESALCSALGEYIERISCNYFYNDHFLGEEVSASSFVHYPDERWFEIPQDGSFPPGLLDDYCLKIYNAEGDLAAHHLLDANSSNEDRGICALPFTRCSDSETVYFPVNLLGNLFVSNGMSAGNTMLEAQVQCLSEIFERAVKKQIIEEELTLPDVPLEVLRRYPKILAGIEELAAKGYPVLVKDASLGGRYPVMNVTLMNPKTGGAFSSFGAHPKFEVALERSLTELLQGRSFEGLNEMPPPTFNSHAVKEPNNFVEHFIDSTGVISWKFFSSASNFEFCDWNVAGSTSDEYAYLMAILENLHKEVYVAQYDYFGAKACRILVPGYSEIYPVEDLVWDNTNKALQFRSPILHIHQLESLQLRQLQQKLEESQFDDYMKISDLIGIDFDENTVWGQLNVGELKILIYLALQDFVSAKEQVESFLTFNENTNERRLFYQAVNALLDVNLDPNLRLDDFVQNFERMFGKSLMQAALGSVAGTVKFFGLTPTNMALDGLDKHKKLVESYKKLHKARYPRARTDLKADGTVEISYS